MNRRLAVNIGLVLVVGFAAYKNFERRINGASEAPPANASQTAQAVVAFGDIYASADAAQGYAKTLSRALNLEVASLGVAGTTSAAALARVDAVVARHPNYVVVSVGLADLEAQTPLDETLRALEALFGRLQDAGALVAYLPVEPKQGTGDNWIMAIEQLCKERKVLVVPPIRVEAYTPEVAADRVRYALEPYL